MSKFKLLNRVTKVGTGVVEILTEAVHEPSFRVDGLMLRVYLTVQNNNVAGQNLLSEQLPQNSTVKIELADGYPMYNNVSWRGLEWLQQSMYRTYLDALVENATRAISAVGGASETQEFWLPLPFADPSAKNPIDFSMALSLIKAVSINVGPTGNVDLVITSITADLVAFGEVTQHAYVGTRTLVVEEPNLAGNTAVPLSLAGRKLSHLIMYSKADATSPIAMTSPNVVIDERLQLVEFQNLNAVDIQKHIGVRTAGTFPARATLAQTEVTPLVLPPQDYELSKLPSGQRITVKSASNPGTAAEQAFIIRTIAPNDELATHVPGGDNSANQLTVQTPGGVLNSVIEHYLPRKIYPPHGAGKDCGCASSCGCA